MVTVGEKSVKVIREKEFARRLELACERHAHSPSGHGRQKWVRNQLTDKMGITVSAEATRKWFAGEARPRPKVMSALAKVLEDDLAWLSLNITPEISQVEARKQNAVAHGATNLVAAHIQLAGGSIAFPEGAADADLYAIIKGKQHSISVKMPRYDESTMRFIIGCDHHKTKLIGVVPTKNPLNYDFVVIPNELVEKYGKQKGGYIEIFIDHAGRSSYSFRDASLPVLKSFANLDLQ